MPLVSIRALLSCVSFVVPLGSVRVPSKNTSMTRPIPAASMPTARLCPVFGDLTSVPDLIPAPSGALELLMSKKSPFTAATARFALA